MTTTDIAQRATRARDSLVACAGHLERLLRFLPALLGDPQRHAAANEALTSALDKLDRVASSLRAQLRRDGSSTQRVSTRCADRLLEDVAQAPPLPDAGPPVCVLRGRSPGFEPTAVLELLSMQNRTGTLRVHLPFERIVLLVADGDIVHAVSDRPPADQLLGSILVQQAALTASQLDQFLTDCGDSTKRVGEALANEQIVTHDQLRAALQEQIQQLFHRLFAAETAEFEFYDGAAAAPDTHVCMSVVHLLLESARVLDEQTAEPAPRQP